MKFGEDQILSMEVAARDRFAESIQGDLERVFVDRPEELALVRGPDARERIRTVVDQGVRRGLSSEGELRDLCFLAVLADFRPFETGQVAGLFADVEPGVAAARLRLVANRLETEIV